VITHIETVGKISRLNVVILSDPDIIGKFGG